MFIRNPYNYDTKQASVDSGLACGPVTRTQQQFRDETDIMTIVRRFHLTGQMPMNPQTPSYGDFGEVFDFQTAMNAIVTAEKGFMELTASVRKRFNNSPQELLLFMEDPANRKEAEDLGLIKGPLKAVEGSTSSPVSIPSTPLATAL